MSGMLAGKVAVVTGAGGGIGRGIAMAMAAAGAKVVVNDIGATLSGEGPGAGAGPAQQVTDMIIAAGGQAVPNTDSVSTRASANAIIEAAVQHFGRIDIVVNNAGNLRDRVFHKMSDEEWSQVIDVHLNGTFFVSRAAANHFREQESGAFVHMTSTSGLIGNLGQANYSAAKLGIAALSKSIALDMQRFNVRSNCIAPFAWSRMTSSIPANTPEEKARVEKLQKMDANKRNQILLLAQNRVLRIAFVDSNNVTYIAGLERGCVMSSGTASTGTAVSDLNGYTLTFQSQEPKSAVILASTLADAVSTGAITVTNA